MWIMKRCRWSDSKPLGWSDLPDDILELISKRLSLVDSIRASAVCRSWRCVDEKKYQVPLLLCSNEHNVGNHLLFNFFDSTSCWTRLLEVQGKRLHGFSCGWWMLTNKDSRMSLFNPILRDEIQLPQLPKHYNIRKATLSCAPTKTGADCIVMAIISPFELFFCRPGDVAWTLFLYARNRNRFEDIIFFSGKFCALLQNVHSDDPCMIQSCPKVIVCNIGCKRRGKARVLRLGELPMVKDGLMLRREIKLVECRGELLLVLGREFDLSPKVRQGNNTDVFKADFGGRSWARVESLGDGALFLGSNRSSLSSARLLEGKGNCIYSIEKNGELRVFDLSNGKVDYFPINDASFEGSCIWVSTNPW